MVQALTRERSRDTHEWAVVRCYMSPESLAKARLEVIDAKRQRG